MLICPTSQAAAKLASLARPKKPWVPTGACTVRIVLLNDYDHQITEQSAGKCQSQACMGAALMAGSQGNACRPAACSSSYYSPT